MGTVLFLSVIFIASALSIILYSLNPARSMASLMLWLVSLVYTLGYLIYKSTTPTHLLKKFSILKLLGKHKLFLFILSLGTTIRFWGISTIPILTHDEAKDAGFFPQKILTGELSDYFGFWAGINHFFFVIAAIPHLLFADPVLKVRFFSALFGVFSAILIYILTKKLSDKRTAIIAILLLSTYHVHIHFSRTEFLGLFDSFYALVILIIFSIYAKHKSIYSVILLAITLGLGLHFYSGLRALILLTGIVFLFTQKSQTKRLRSVFTFFVFFLIAIGPMLVVFITRPMEAFANGTAKVATQEGGITLLFTNYANSLLAYVYKPIDFHYHYGGPFLVLPFSLFFLIGVYFALKNFKNANFALLILACLGIPFFNSAILTDINYTHRLMSLIPFIILLTSIGMNQVANKIRKRFGGKTARGFLIILCAGFSIYNLHLYFVQNIWEKTLFINEFRAWEAQKIVNSLEKDVTTAIFIGNQIMPEHISVHPLPYLTQNRHTIDIINLDHLDDVLKNNSGKSFTLIVLPQNKIGLDAKAIEDRYESTHAITQRKVFYKKDMELFDEVNIRLK